MRRSGVQRKIARAVTVLLLSAGLAQLVVALFVIRQETLTLRDGLLQSGLRMARAAVRALPPAQLEAELGELPGFGVATYDANGVLLSTTRADAQPARRLTEAQRRAADREPDRAVLLENNDLLQDNVGIMRVSGVAPVQYVGLYDRWAPTRVDAALSQGLLTGFVANALVGILATLWLARRMRRRLADAELVVDRMAAGELGLRLPRYGRDEVGRLAERFNEMATQLERRMSDLNHERDARRRAFADWTHELSTPLTSVLGYLETLEMSQLDKDTEQRYVRTALRQARALEALCDDLGTLARLDFDGLTLDVSSVDLGKLVRAEVEGMQSAAGGVILHVDALESGPVVPGDGRRLGQVLRNLLSNALRHTPAGRSVCVDVELWGDTAAVTVADQGVGIAPEHLPRLGERFYRVEAARDRRSGGRGLGLAIARGIVEAHGGTLRIESKLGVGTRVRVELPTGHRAASRASD